MCACLRLSTHDREAKRRQFSQISRLPVCDHISVPVFSHLSHPFISCLALSLSPEVNAGSLRCCEHVQHQDYASNYWLMAGDLTNGKRDRSYGSPSHPIESQPMGCLGVHACACVSMLLTHCTSTERNIKCEEEKESEGGAHYQP